ncbi:MAG TPA: C25 family cysteine peptidase [Candidatus Eisenbacteria bacterium]|nr:C25 family cysteine peptidase [Candidatus Eisenbacteria bacterium]
MARVSPAPERRPPPAGLAAPFAPTLTPSLSGSAVEGIILTADSLASSLQPLADYHTRMGHPTVVRTLGTVRAEDPRSNDLAQAIRTFLTRARTLWGTEWVLLAGDHESIPLRMVVAKFSETEEIATDAYYSDLDGTWDGNGNGIFGEVADSLDMEPDLRVGRLSVENRAQATAQVAKLLRYRRAPPAAPLSKHLLFADVLFPRNWTAGQTAQLDGAVQGESLRAHLAPCIAPDRLYENYTKYPGASPLTKTTALSALSHGYAVVQAIGHGSRSQIAVGNDLITIADLATLSSGDSAALWVASNCASAAADFDCFGEALVRKPFGGAIAYVGATRDAWPGVSELVAEVVTSRAVPEQGAGVPLGDAVDAARRALLPLARAETAQRWGYFETILLGDPLLRVWNCAPTTLSVTAPSGLALGAGGFPVSVTSGGAPVESALVVAVKAGEDYRAVYTDAAGEAWIPFLPASTGPFSLTVSAPNALAFEDSIAVSAAPSAHFAFLSLSDDDAVHGDGDGRVDAGERFGFSGSVKNSGAVASGDPITIEVEALAGNLVVEQAAATLPGLAPGASAPIPAALRVLASGDPNAPRAGQLRLIARDGTRADSTIVGVSVAAASLVLAGSTLVDSPGDGDGIPESGETSAWSWRIANEGTGAARGVTLRARTPAAGVTLLDSAATLPDLDPGAAAQADVPIRFSLAAPVAGRLFDLHLLDARGHSWVVEVSRDSLPSAPAALRVSGSTVNSIAFEWTPSPSPRLLGYHVYRAFDDGSPLARVTPVPVRASALYENAGLALLTRYRFAVAAVDSSGNEGPQTAPIVASTTPPSVAGWPAEMAQPTSSNIALGDLDGDGKPELVVGADVLYAFHFDGTEVRDGDSNPVSTGIFSTLLHNIPSSPAVADVDLDGAPDIVAASWNDSLVAVFRADGSLLPGWPKKGGAPFWSSPAIGDIDNDGQLEVVIGSNGSRLYAWHADGTEVRDGDANAATDGVLLTTVGSVISSPAIADLDGDGQKEVVFGTSGGRVYAIHSDGTALAGWPFVAGAGVFSSSPAVGNIVAGPGLEVAIASSNDSLYVLTAGGQRAPGWPRAMELTPGNGRTVSPALAPLRIKLGDPTLQVVIAGADGSLHAFEPNGTPTAGFASLFMGGPTEASPSIVDLDGDGSPEILIGSEDRRLYAFAADGSSVSGFPIETGAEVRSTPAVWDLDGDGAAEIALSGWDRKLHVWRYPGFFSPIGAPWPMWRHDNWHTGLWSFPVLTFADPPPVPAPEAPPAMPWLGRNKPNPFNPATVIGFGVPGPAPAEVRVVVFDVSGRKVATLVSRRLDPGYHEARWDGRTDHGAAAGSGIYLLRAEIGPTVLTRKLALVR